MLLPAVSHTRLAHQTNPHTPNHGDDHEDQNQRQSGRLQLGSLIHTPQRETLYANPNHRGNTMKTKTNIKAGGQISTI